MKTSKSIKDHYDSFIKCLEEKIGEKGFLNDEEYDKFCEEIKPFFRKYQDQFPEVRLLINRFIEKHKINKTCNTIREIYKRHKFLETRLRDTSLNEEERQDYQKEFNELSERIYFLER